MQVTPFAWEVHGEVNTYVARVSEELSERGHRVLIMAPAESAALVRDTRRTLRSEPESLLERAASGPVVLGVGEVLPFAPARRRAASLPVDVARTIEEALSELPIDVVHVHEPFAPSASSVALRHSRALNVASFHAPTERLLSTQLTRPLSRLLFGRLDARIASYRATRDLIQRYFPAEYEVILPGADVAERSRRARRRGAVCVRRRGSRRAAGAAARAALAPAGARVARDGVVARTAGGAGDARRTAARAGRAAGRQHDLRGRGRSPVPTSRCWRRRGSAPRPGTLVRALAAGRRAGRLAPARLRGAALRRRLRPPVPARRRTDARRAT